MMQLLEAFSKPGGKGFILLEGPMKAKILGLYNLVVEGDSTTIISWLTKKERELWSVDEWFSQIFFFFFQYYDIVGMLIFLGSSLI